MRIGRGIALCAVGALALSLLAEAAWARPPDERRHGPPPLGAVLERHAERLGLDDAMRAQIREIAAEGREAAEVHHERVRALYQELRELLSAESPDEPAIMRKAEEIGEAKTAKRKQRLRTMLSIRALLTPEQRRELVRIHEEMREAWREKRHGRDWRDDTPAE